MNLLNKFNAIEIAADTRISEADRVYCQTQQEAYDHARGVLKVMAERSRADMDEQVRLLGRNGEDVYETATYLGKVRPSDFADSLRDSHSLFIGRIFSYFRQTYKVTISESDAKEVLLPKKPDDSRAYTKEEIQSLSEAVKTYNESLNNLALKYSDILDQVFIQLGGFTFKDKAVQELKDAAHKAGWNSYNGKKAYEQKKAVLSFPGYACHFDGWYEEYHKGEHQIELTDSMKAVVRALAHFDLGIMSDFPYRFSVLLGYNWKTDDTEMPFHLDKLKSIKCFKNGRVDVRFTSEAYARQFAAEYLGDAV
ncbi:MAG: hypothetical protein IJX14_04750 [Clostridia bacterium]|nr:hypothetical protein [Clostridia bacterium]